jgi:hypothetical protein
MVVNVRERSKGDNSEQAEMLSGRDDNPEMFQRVKDVPKTQLVHNEIKALTGGNTDENEIVKGGNSKAC